MEHVAYGNLSVIVVTCLVSWRAFYDPELMDRFIFWPQGILGCRQYYRLVTSALIHLNGRHLIFNMISLYFFGPAIEWLYGWPQFFAIYIGSILGGDLLSLWVHRHHDYRALGASGGVAGIIFAYIILFPGSHIGMYFLPIGIPGWLYAIVYLLAFFYGMKKPVCNVGHDAHLGGALVGLFIAAGFHPNAIRYNPILFGSITAGSILLLIYLVKNPMLLPLEGFDFTRKRPAPAAAARARRPLTSRLSAPFRKRSRTKATPRKAFSERDMDSILQKISDQGMDSLTEEERRFLQEVSDKYRRRSGAKGP